MHFLQVGQLNAHNTTIHKHNHTQHNHEASTPGDNMRMFIWLCSSAWGWKVVFHEKDESGICNTVASLPGVFAIQRQ
jgi:hypothetical protein